jgi:hydrogenase nickel incorporation protein HypA/HybF
MRYAPRVHELSVCQALLTQVTDITAGRGAVVVERITIEMGPLCGLEPALLASAFAIARTGGCAAQAELVIESTAVMIACTACGAQSQTASNRLVCAACGGFRTRIVAGDEMRLRRVELQMEQMPRESAVN